VREEAITLLKLPGLVLSLTMNHSSLPDAPVSLLTSLLCTGSSNSHNEWMKQYIKVSRRRTKNIRMAESCFEQLQKQLDDHLLSILGTASVWSVTGQPLVDVAETESGLSRSQTPQPATGPADPANETIAVLAEQEETMELGYGISSEVLQEQQQEVTNVIEREDQGSLSLEDAATVIMDSQVKSCETAMGNSTSIVQQQGGSSPSVDGVGAISDSAGDRTHDHLSSIAVFKANRVLRLYCILLGTGVLNLSRVSSQLLIELMTQHPPISSSGVHYVELSISLLMTCPHLVSDVQRSQRFTTWLKWLLRNHNKFECLSPGEGRCTEMLLLIAIHFHNSHYEAIVDLVTDIIGVQGCVRASSFASLRIMFTQEVFTEEVLVEHASRVPITKQLNGDMSGLLPVNCVHEMITTHLFENCNISIQDWLYGQIQHSTYPLHSLLPVIIQKFVSSLIFSSKIDLDTRDRGFSETEILSIFSPPSHDCYEKDHNTPQLLMLFYVLTYQQKMLNVKHNAVLCTSYQLCPLSPSVLESIPIKPLIRLADCHHERYSELSPLLTCLISSLFPELAVAEDWLEEEDSSPNVSQTVIMKDVEAFLSGWVKYKSNKCKPTHLQLKRALTTLDTTDPNTLPCLLHLESLDRKYLLRYTNDLMMSLTTALDQTVSRQIQVLLRNIWFRLNSIIPRRFVSGDFCGYLSSCQG
jgi:integrator complex subunit 2